MTSSSSLHYNVFLSFRGIDTRKNFISHLYQALVDRGITTFKDDATIRLGKIFPPEILKAIQNSSFAIITISKNFASSMWCLIELQSIMKLNREQCVIVPIFYGVKPSDLRDEEGDFLKQLKEIKDISSFVEEVPKWKAALKNVSTLQGKNPTDFENDATMIKKIVQYIDEELSSRMPIDYGNVVGMGPHEKKLLPLLKIDSENDVRVIGIWGMGGIGKTTIVDYLFNRYSRRFPARCLMRNVSEDSKYRNLLYLQKEFISKTLPIRKCKFEHSTVEEGRQVIESRFGHQRVFVILDGVEAINQIEAVAKKTSMFGPGSRIIITARDRKLLENYGIREDDLYEVLCLGKDHSLLMFKHYAFEGGSPPSTHFEQLSIRASELAHGLPYALEALGSCFLGKTDISEWEAELSRLEETPLENTTIKKTMKILNFSYKDLEKQHKRTFLYVACLFNGDPIQQVGALLDDFGSSGIKVLADKSLVNISTDGRIRMHVFVEQMGKLIVGRKSKKRPQQQRILWDPQEICKILRLNSEMDHIECLALHMCKMLRNLKISCNHFMLMHNLKYLKFYKHLDDIKSKLQFVPEYHLPPSPDLELRLLHWDAYPSRTLPFNLNLKCIVEINLRYSNLQSLWDGTQELVNLRKLDLKGSKNLRKLPDISKAKKLEDLLMDGCTRLERFPVYICSLSNLVELHAIQCGGLQSLHIDIKSAKTLQESNNKSCPQFILEFSNEVEPLESLANLSIEGKLKFQISQLEGDADHFSFSSERPQKTKFCDYKRLVIKRNNYKEDYQPFKCLSFLDFPLLMQLNLVNLKIKNIPETIGELNSLEQLNLSGNDFEKLPKTMENLSKLKHLLLRNCRKLEALPLLIKVETLILSNCINLQSILELSTLEDRRTRFDLIELELDNCNNVQSLSDQLSHFTNLKELNLSRHNFVRVPKSIKELTSLRTLTLNYCMKLKSLEELPLSLKCLHAHGCDLLENVSLSSDHSLEDIDLHHCFHLNLDDHILTRFPSNYSHGEKVTSQCGCSITSRLLLSFPLTKPILIILIIPICSIMLVYISLSTILRFFQ